MSIKTVDYHYSVMGREVEEGLFPSLQKPHSLFADATLGEGGHTFRLLSRFPTAQAVAIEADALILARAEERLASLAHRIEFVNDWSHNVFKEVPARAFDGILMDLGISTFHYYHSGRGFSFSGEELLDMRLNPSVGESAADVVNHFREEDLADLFYQLGEERYSRKYARVICESRRVKPFTTTKELTDLVWKVAPNRYGKTHPATKIFQALRIHVNGELSQLEAFLSNAMNHLVVEGRLVVITFHSLEDRIVKHAFRRWAKIEGSGWRLATKRAIQPSEEEVKENPPSRSAKLRIIERVAE